MWQHHDPRVNPCQLQRASTQGKGNSIFTPKAIPSKTHLINIPYNIIIDLDAAVNHPVFGEFMRKYKLVPNVFENRPETEAWPIIFFLAYIKAHKQAFQEYVPYLEILPSLDQVHCATNFSTEQLHNLVGGTKIFSKVDQLEMDFQQMVARTCAVHELGCPVGLIRWAYCIYWSRALQIPVTSLGRPVQCSALVPYLDSLNHRPGSLHTLATDFGLKQLVLVAGSDIAQEEEVCINYGHKSNATLLLHYGFTLEGNLADYVDIDIVPGETFRVYATHPLPSGLLDSVRNHVSNAKVSGSVPYESMSLETFDWTDANSYSNDDSWFSLLDIGSLKNKQVEQAALLFCTKFVKEQITERQQRVDKISDVDDIKAQITRGFFIGEIRVLEALQGILEKLAKVV
mmetsp:Transcript_45158/g.72347  ORF Transcript_45158/g.72347 Transcript_45158/m.72347 type:complete len:400 (+) Transcript_45158:193-1392(+)|eukprot:CAMPEP_0203760448 /NCGR_PEP_ID=MMETSP0098-20131031/13737_1 /ASSEMBLY_ACC=CAM_ASM_000208 /TAXON_ID=96639 /ORGANISM=" , Strain NY0313808BC1" /LENGTH=399 /DNA_ID=CAMNT_0050654009 /DNA_START=139 /DNA_END=1338 /DNA_ORIENTATION=-